MDFDAIANNNDDITESIIQIPLFSYLVVSDELGNILLAHSFNFDSDNQCETFFQINETFSFQTKSFELVTEIIQKLLERRLKKYNDSESAFIDFSENPFYVTMLQYHSIYFIAVYPEMEGKFTNAQKEHIHASLKGIASSFFAVFYSETNIPNITYGSTALFLETIPVILYQNSLKKTRNCRNCSIEKKCIPKLIEKKIQIQGLI